MLVGHIDDGVTHIIGSVSALSAAAEQVSLTFTHEVWDEILKTVNKDFAGSTIVGWYHTHPSFGLFLSDYDEFIQRNFFSHPGQVALVIDPIAGTSAWFAQNGNDIAKFGEQATRRGSRRRPGEAGQLSVPSGLSWPRVAILGVGVAVLSAALVWGLTASTATPDVRGALADKTAALGEKTRALAELGVAYSELAQTKNLLLENPILVYTVVDGDTLASITARFYGSSDIDFLLSANSLSADSELEIGETLLLPGVPGVTVAPNPNNEITTPVIPSPSPSPAPASPSPSPSPQPSP